MAKKIDIDKYASGLFQRTEQYAEKVRQHYATAVAELLKLSANSRIEADAAFSFSDNKKLSEKANEVLRRLYSAVYNEIKGGVSAEWEYANLSCDALIESIFGKGLAEDNHFARWFTRNQEAMDAFFKRKSEYGGMNLSQKVWKYTSDFKNEMELALSVSLGQGDSASTVSRKVRQYLQEPDKLFRRIRIGTDKDGKPKFKLSKAAKAYHPGRGVYRSSYKNAMRLTRNEINMAYKTSEQDRWQRMDFVVGYEVRLSNNHPEPDLCDALAGKYPKTFKFTPWHPQCRCILVPILATEDEFIKMQQKILNGESPATVRLSENVRYPHEGFYEWWKSNKDRLETSVRMPYWAQDNQDLINKKRSVKTKTDEEREAIRKAWAERAKKNQLVIKMATNVAKVASEYPEIDLSALQMFIDKKNIASAKKEAQSVAKQVVSVRNDEKALSVLIPDVHEWKKQFTSAELHKVYDAVEKKLETLSILPLEEQSKKLKFEIYDFLGGNMNGVQQKYSTWKVSQAAYIKQHASVLQAIDWKDIDGVLQEALTFKTKSKPYLDLIEDLKAAIAENNLAKAKSVKADMQFKREELRKAAQARARKKAPATAGGNFDASDYTQEAKDNAIWCKSASESHSKWDGISDTIWNSASQQERDGWYYYTAGSGHMNRPLRGYDHTASGSYSKWSKDNFKGVGNVNLNVEGGEEHIRSLYALIERTAFTENTWLQRGIETWDGVEGFFGVNGLTREKLRGMVGKEVTDYSFVSCGSAKGTGFSGLILNIYCPKGTKGIYAAPRSAYKSENETILQAGTRFRITKVEAPDYGCCYVDIEIIGYDKHPSL